MSLVRVTVLLLTVVLCDALCRKTGIPGVIAFRNKCSGGGMVSAALPKGTVVGYSGAVGDKVACPDGTIWARISSMYITGGTGWVKVSPFFLNSPAAANRTAPDGSNSSVAISTVSFHPLSQAYGLVYCNKEDVITAAQTHSGTCYVWGGDSPAGFDCSGFVWYVLRNDLQLVNWPREAVADIRKRFLPIIDPSAVERGDLVFFATSHVAFVTKKPGIRSYYGANGGNESCLKCSQCKCNSAGTLPKDACVKSRDDWDNDPRAKSYGSLTDLLAQ